MDTQRRILLVEDEVHIARAIATILKKALTGYGVDVARDGVDALERLSSQDYAMIISDWNMPRKDGAELLADLRADDKTAALPFIMLTAKGDKDSVAAAYEAGANEYIIKPFKPPEFVAKVKALLAGDGDTDSAELQAATSPLDAVVVAFKQGKAPLPLLPGMVKRVNELLARDDASVAELAAVVELDAGIAGSLIGVANSALMRGSHDCVSVERAITRMGLEEARNYITAQANRALFVAERPELKVVLEDLWQHSLATAYCARYLGQALGYAPLEKFFLLGLLHDIGKLALVGIMNEVSKTRNDLDEQHIQQIMKQLHAEFGVALLKRWGYCDEFQNVIQYHHLPFNAREITQELLVVYLANLMVRRIGLGKGDEDIDNVADSQAAIKLGVSGEMITQVLERTSQAMAAVRQVC